MSLIADRKKNGAVCPRCRHPEYLVITRKPPLKPEFQCDSCGHIWAYGKDGGKYMELMEEAES